MVPSADSGDDLVRVLGPAERLRVLICLFDEAVDGGLEGDDEVEHATLQSAVGQLGEEAFDGVDPGETEGLRRDAEVGVKWKVSRSCRPSHSMTLGCLWVA